MAEYTKAQLTDMIIGKLQRNFGRTVEEATAEAYNAAMEL